MSNKRTAHRRPKHSQATLAGNLSDQINQALLDGLTGLGGREEGAGAALLVARAAKSVAPEQLAQARPVDAAAREQLRATYEKCLSTYRNVVRARDAELGFDDAGAALAFFVAANLYALTDIQPTPDVVARLERQLSGLARMTSTWDTASVTERQIYFEKMATIGVLVAGLTARARSQGQGAIAAIKRVARGYLRQLLALDPDLLALGPDGLTLKTARAAGRPAATVH